jgi:hypothetical protein
VITQKLTGSGRKAVIPWSDRSDPLWIHGVPLKFLFERCFYANLTHQRENDKQVDPQLGQYPAASIPKAVARKPVAEVDDQTMILADQAEKAVSQMGRNRYQGTFFLTDPV